MKAKSFTKQTGFFARALIFWVTLLLLACLTVSTVFALDTGFSSPSKASSPGKSWTNISSSLKSDNLYATSKRPNKQLKLSKFTIPGIPGGSTINGIEVTVEGYTGGLQANVALSYNGGANYTAAYITTLTGTETTITLGGATNNWGRTWAASNFTNANFLLRLTTTGTGAPIYVDQVRVKVYYTLPTTTLNLSPVSGPYGGTASMSAALTLTAGGAPIPAKTIDFYLGGNGIDINGNCTGTYAGSATTNASGVATLASASLSGINAGTYPYGACAGFAGDLSSQATSISGSLNVIGTPTELVAAPATGTYGDSVTLSATLTSNGTPFSGQSITFYLFGNPLGSATTNASGVASLSGVSLVGYYAGASNDIEAVFEGNNNFNPASANALITINPRPLTVTAVKDIKAYDGTTSSIGVPKITSGSLVTGDVAGFSQTFASKDVGTGITITPTGAVEDDNSGLNYTVTFESITTGQIAQTTLTVTANNQIIYIGQPDPVFTFKYAGLVNGETSDVLDVKPGCTVSVPHSAVGTYPIVCSGGADNNYSFSYVNGTFRVSDVTFADVPYTYWAWGYIERLHAAGITGGCSVSPLMYCPNAIVTRAQMAIFLLRGIHGSSYTPPNVGNNTGFSDVPVTHPAAAWIKELYTEGITGGCGPGIYCPENPVTRDQMAVFLLRSKYSYSYSPPSVGSSTGFADVPTDYWAAAWIKQLVLEEITTGCGGGNYCPSGNVTRDQMAIFLVRTFNLP